MKYADRSSEDNMILGYTNILSNVGEKYNNNWSK